MEKEKVKSFLISEYERWFSVTTDELRKSREDDETKAELLERSREQLAGMLMFIRGQVRSHRQNFRPCMKK